MAKDEQTRIAEALEEIVAMLKTMWGRQLEAAQPSPPKPGQKPSQLKTGEHEPRPQPGR